MRITIVDRGRIPVSHYGGTQRVIWYLGQELSRMGHQVSFLVAPGSTCPFARIIPLDSHRTAASQIPENTDIVHFHFDPGDVSSLSIPYIITNHGNRHDFRVFDPNTVFVSKNHAQRYGSECFVYNGLDWDDYGKPNLEISRRYFHFLGKAAWKVKNLSGAIQVIKQTPHEKLYVLGGKRVNLSMGIRITLSPRVKFFGMVGGTKKLDLLQHSKGLLFPVLWNEPFGLAIIESLYFGCPVFGTPYGSLPELVTPEVGFLSCNCKELAEALLLHQNYHPEICHEYALENFNAKQMALGYLECYEQVLDGKTLNPLPPVWQGMAEEVFEWK
jgi:glycosyltransferase involved in cell wall biosynthesis